MERQVVASLGDALKGVRLLVVEDDAILLMELEEVLEAAGAEIVGLCRTVKDALATVERAGISAAVLDVRIGNETIAPVARKLGRCGTPFVFYTGQMGCDPALEEWRGCKVVAKPAQAQTIVSAVVDLLHGRH
jgi:DNA-binding NtrC family response regulator